MDVPERPYRVDRALVVGELPLLAILLADLAFGLWALPRLRGKVPVDWILTGEADRFARPGASALVAPLLGIVFWALVLLLPLVDPLRKNYSRFPGTLKLVRWLLPLMNAAVHVVLTLGALGLAVDHDWSVRAILAVFFIVFGNSMGKLRHNWFIGIRTPWTIANEEVWTRTHRLAAPIWVAGGLVQLAGAFVPGTPGEILFAAPLAAMTLVPIAYSYLAFRKLSASGCA